MKYAEYGDLYSYLEQSERFDAWMTRYVLNQIIEGLSHLHNSGIVHRDIKPENLLINRKGKVIIADFSFAIRLAEIDCDDIF